MAIAWDESAPGDSSSIPAFPANERAFRAAVKAAYGIEHDDAEGRHAFGVGSTAARDAITTWVDGSFWVNNTGGRYRLMQRVSGTWEYVVPPSEFANRDESGLWSIYQGAATATVSPTAGTPNPVAVSATVSPHRKVTLSANSILSNPSGFGSNRMTVITMEVLQNGTGGWTLTFDSQYVFPSRIVPLISTAANSRSVLNLMRLDDGKWLVTLVPDVGV